jgi:RNA polymerase sigma factor for flagellar operon FliA
MDKKERDKIVCSNFPLVKLIAYHLISRLPPSVQVDDLIQSGMIGLMQAAVNYDPPQGASFETYAGIRIRGEMLDEIRRANWTPRSVYRKARQVLEAIRCVENRIGRNAKHREVAEEMGVSLKEYDNILADLVTSRLFALDDAASSSNEEEVSITMHSEDDLPENKLAKEEFVEFIKCTVKRLPANEQIVTVLYYNEELNLREIGELFGFSEAWACIQCGIAKKKLKTETEQYSQGYL